MIQTLTQRRFRRLENARGRRWIAAVAMLIAMALAAGWGVTEHARAAEFERLPAPGSVYAKSAPADGIVLADHGGPELDVDDTLPPGMERHLVPCVGSRWYTQADVLFLSRTSPTEDILVAIGGDNGPPQPIVTTDDLVNDYEAGMRLSLGRLLGTHGSIEFSYFGLHHWGDDLLITDPPDGAETIFGGEEFTSASLVTRTEIHNAEMNLRHQMSPMGRVTAATLIGVRYFRLSDRFALSQDLVPSMDGPGISLFDTSTDNDLIGMQLGAEMLCNVTSRLRLGVSGKAGLMLNLVDMESTVDSRDLGRFTVGSDDERLSGLVEVGLNATWRVTRHLAVRGGYQVVYVGGVALASENFDPLGLLLDPQVGDNGDVVLDGPSAGFEVIW